LGVGERRRAPPKMKNAPPRFLREAHGNHNDKINAAFSKTVLTDLQPVPRA